MYMTKLLYSLSPLPLRTVFLDLNLVSVFWCGSPLLLQSVSAAHLMLCLQISSKKTRSLSVKIHLYNFLKKKKITFCNLVFSLAASITLIHQLLTSKEKNLFSHTTLCQLKYIPTVYIYLL